MIRLAEGWSFGLNGVLQKWGAAEIVLSLAYDVAEFLEEVLQLLLLGGQQVCWDRRREKRFGGGWWRWRVGDGNDLQSAHILSGM